MVPWPAKDSPKNTPKWDSKKVGASSKKPSGSVAHVKVKYAKLPGALSRVVTILPGEE